MVEEDEENKILENSKMNNKNNIETKEATNEVREENSETSVKLSELKKNTDNVAHSTSKLDTLSKDDLTRIVKKQLLTINNARKQMEMYKKKTEEKMNTQGTNENTKMIFMELNDYKESLEKLKKQLKINQTELEAKDEAIKALSDNIERLNEEKENYMELLNQSNEDLNKLKVLLEEKTRLITENSKEINSLVSQISEIKSQMETEIISLNKLNALQNQKLIEEKQCQVKNSRETQKLKEERMLLQQKYEDLNQQYCTFKERAQYVLQQQSLETNEVVSIKNNSVEVQDLIENLETKNEKVSKLTNKCAFLEDNLYFVEQHLQSIQIELDSVLENKKNEQNSYQKERQKIKSDFEVRLKQLQDFIIQLKEEKRLLSEENLAEQVRIKESFMDKVEKLNSQNHNLKEEVNKIKKEICANNNENQNFEKHKTKNKLGLQLKLEERSSTPSYNLYERSNSFNEDEESESDDMQSLKSVIEQSFVENFEIGLSKATVKFSNSVDYRLQMESLDKQLSHTRDLLADTEETNLRLVEQVQILKEEIRRLERNIERQKHINNMEYFKNIMVKFLAPEQVSDERAQLLPVLRTMLHLSNEECEQIQNYIDNTTQLLEKKSSNNINNKDWTGYFGNLSSIF